MIVYRMNDIQRGLPGPEKVCVESLQTTTRLVSGGTKTYHGKMPMDWPDGGEISIRAMEATDSLQVSS